jgi:hypothetical protein
MAAPHAAVTAKHKPRQAHAAREHTTGTVNKVVRWVLRSRLHGLLSSWLMLATYTGRKSGKTYTTPVSYVKSGDGVVFFNSHSWWHNFESRSPVTLRIKGHDLHGIALAVPDPYESEPVVRAYLEEKGVRSAWTIGLKLKAKTMPDREELARAIAESHAVMVRVRSSNRTPIEI